MRCSRDEQAWVCSLCGREVPNQMITQHHLTPRERGGKPDDRVPMCRPCHKQIHALFDNRELEARLHDLTVLRRDDRVQRFVRWVRRQPVTSNIVARQSRDRRRRR